jgi:transposase
VDARPRGGGTLGPQQVDSALAPNLYYRWSKEFLEAGKKRLVGDTSRDATAPEVSDLRKENARLKQVVAEIVLENRPLKKSVTAADSDDEVSG